MIEFSHVYAGYPGNIVLEDISLTLPRGKITSLIGPNGCGKTTLLKTACGLLPLAGGDIFFSGKKIGDFSPKEFARCAAVLPQVRDIPALSVERFVTHGRYPHLSFGRSLTIRDMEMVQQAMEQTNTLELRHKVLSQLSGGQRQRVYLAMTLAQDGDILFLDEPTTYLDVGQKYEMLELIKKINLMGKTVVMVLHDLPLAFSYSHEIAVLGKGGLLAFGPSRQVFDSGIPAKIFGVAGETVTVKGETQFIFTKAHKEDAIK